MQVEDRGHLGNSGSEDDEEERWEDEQHHREHHLDGREPCELFRPLTTLGTKLQRLILQDLCEAHPERVGLDDRIYEPADVGKGGAASEFTQRLMPVPTHLELEQ